MMRNEIRMMKRLVRTAIGREVLYFPEINIPTERHGSEYGGWIIAAGSLLEQSVVYSFGIGDDITFDLSLIHSYDVTIHAYDPTPRSIDWLLGQNLPEKFIWYPVGIADYDGTAHFIPPEEPTHVSYSIDRKTEHTRGQYEASVRRLASLMKDNGHDHIDLLKMDIEGSEYKVLRDILTSRISIKQILVEFHHRFANLGVSRTKNAVHALKAAGYKLFSVSPRGEEYSFIRE